METSGKHREPRENHGPLCSNTPLKLILHVLHFQLASKGMFSHSIQSFKISSASNTISNVLTLSGSAQGLVHSQIINLVIWAVQTQLNLLTEVVQIQLIPLLHSHSKCHTVRIHWKQVQHWLLFHPNIISSSDLTCSAAKAVQIELILPSIQGGVIWTQIQSTFTGQSIN